MPGLSLTLKFAFQLPSSKPTYEILMRLSQVLLAIAASFLFTGKVLSVTTDSNTVQVAKMASLGPRQRHLRANTVDDDDDDDPFEDRGLLPKDFVRLKKYAEKLGIDVERAMRNTAYLNEVKEEYAQYKALLNKLITKRKTKKAK